MYGPWGQAGIAKYQEGRYDGLVIVPDRRNPPATLDFLGELPGLRSFSLSARVKDDLGAFHVETMEELTLVTGSRTPVPNVVQPNLRSLCITDRPGVAVREKWPSLRSLRIGTWRGVDCRFVSGAESLEDLHLEGMRQAGSIDGIESCRMLKRVTSVNYSVRETAPLRPLSGLTEVKLLAARPTPPHEDVDLADVGGPNVHKVWISNAQSIHGIDALGAARQLRELRLIDCVISETGEDELVRLPKHVSVQIVTRGVTTSR
jgi:hypothetical protein